MLDLSPKILGRAANRSASILALAQKRLIERILRRFSQVCWPIIDKEAVEASFAWPKETV